MPEVSQNNGHESVSTKEMQNHLFVTHWNEFPDGEFSEVVTEQKVSQVEFLSEIRQNGITKLSQATQLLEMVHNGDKPIVDKKEYYTGGAIGLSISSYLESLTPPDRLKQTVLIHEVIRQLCEQGLQEDQELANTLEKIAQEKKLDLGSDEKLGMDGNMVRDLKREIASMSEEDPLLEGKSPEEILDNIHVNSYQELVADHVGIGFMLRKLRQNDFDDIVNASSMFGWIRQKIYTIKQASLDLMDAWVDGDVELPQIEENKPYGKRWSFRLQKDLLRIAQRFESAVDKKFHDSDVDLGDSWMDLYDQEQEQENYQQRLLENFPKEFVSKVTVLRAAENKYFCDVYRKPKRQQ